MTRRARIILWLTALAGASGGVAALLLAAIVPLDDPTAVPIASGRPVTTRPAAATPAGLAAFDGLLDLNLRRPLVDPPDVVPVVTDSSPAAAPRPTVHVVGAVVEPGHCFAIISDADGATRFCAPGESIAGAVIESIDSEGVTVRFAGQAIRFPIEKAMPAPPVGAALMGAQPPPTSEPAASRPSVQPGDTPGPAARRREPDAAAEQEAR